MGWHGGSNGLALGRCQACIGTALKLLLEGHWDSIGWHWDGRGVCWGGLWVALGWPQGYAEALLGAYRWQWGITEAVSWWCLSSIGAVLGWHWDGVGTASGWHWGNTGVCIRMVSRWHRGSSGVAPGYPHGPCVPPAWRRSPLPRRWTRWAGARRQHAALIPRGGDKWEVTRVCVDGYLW